MRRVGVLVAAMGMLGLVGTQVPAASAAGVKTAGVKTGGSMTIFEVGGTSGNWPTGIDPPNDTSPGLNQDQMSSVYGELFELANSGRAVPDLATGYKILDKGKTYEFDIRHGVKFTDGTAFDAQAVKFNYVRDFGDKASHNPPWPLATTNPFTTQGKYKFFIHLTTPYSPLVNSLYDSPQDWIVSPTSLQKEGEKKFSLFPVGAGPFTVSADTQNVSITFKKNPNYWQKGRPYLDTLTFKSVQSDNTALEDMEAGQGQGYIDMTTLQLVPAYQKAGFTVTEEKVATPEDVQINTTRPPFNNIVAREALYYATNAAALEKAITGSTAKPLQGFTTSAGLFYYPTVPGYRTYDLAKAKALVKQLGGLSFQMMSNNTADVKLINEALQQDYEAAGMKVTLNILDQATVNADYASNNWQASPENSGSWDPAIGVGQNVRFMSGARFSGVKDPKLNALLIKATTVPETKRAAVYKQIANYESQQAYAVELFPVNLWNITDKNVSAPGLTSQHPAVIGAPETWWQDAHYTS